MRIHLIGVCGTAMGTLAALLKRRGHDVTGSDEHVYPPMSDFLAVEGIPLLDGYRAEHVSGALDLVVVGNAVSRGNPELEAVLDGKRRYTSLPEAIRDFFLWQARSIVIAGTHGKTTTTSLVAQWMMTRKLLENWLIWIAVDIVYVPMFIARQLYPTAALYAVFLGLAVLGYRDWRRSLRRQAAGA